VTLDPIFAKHQPILDEKLNALNKALKKVTPAIRQKMLAKLLPRNAAKERNLSPMPTAAAGSCPKRRGGNGKCPLIRMRTGLMH
jgi:hypothetical protein